MCPVHAPVHALCMPCPCPECALWVLSACPKLSSYTALSRGWRPHLGPLYALQMYLITCLPTNLPTYQPALPTYPPTYLVAYLLTSLPTYQPHGGAVLTEFVPRGRTVRSSCSARPADSRRGTWHRMLSAGTSARHEAIAPPPKRSAGQARVPRLLRPPLSADPGLDRLRFYWVSGVHTGQRSACRSCVRLQAPVGPRVPRVDGAFGWGTGSARVS